MDRFRFEISTSYFNILINRPFRSKFITIWFAFGMFMMLPILFFAPVLCIYILTNQRQTSKLQLNSYFYGHSSVLPLGDANFIFLIPGITLSFQASIIWIITLLFSAIFHEAGHALCGQNRGVFMKRSGIFLLFIFPGAFVSLDNEMLKLKSVFSRVMIICAGPFHNIVLGFMSFKLIANLPILFSWGYHHSRTDGTGLMVLKSNAKGLILTELNDHPVIGSLQSSLELPSPTRCVKPVVNNECCHSELIVKENLNCIWDLKSIQSYKSSRALQLSNVTPRSCSLFDSETFYESQKCIENECEDPALQCMAYFGNLLYLGLVNRFNDTESQFISFVGNFQNAFLLSEFTPIYTFLPISLPFLAEIFLRYFYSLNLVLGIVNMFPAFHFDGQIAFSIICSVLGQNLKKFLSLWPKITSLMLVFTMLMTIYK